MPTLKTIDSNGSPRNRVDLIFAGDGYRSEEIGTAYASHVDSVVDHLFSSGDLTEPFGRYRNFFNIYRADVVSADSGADDPAAGLFRDTALDASYAWDGVTDRLLYVDETKTAAALDAALAGRDDITPDMVLVTVNEAKYGGTSGRYSVIAGGNEKAGEIAAHEVGHSFAGLADEYGGAATRYSGDEPPQPNVTTDPDGAKWSSWLGYDQPGIGTIGAYEGGLYHDSGIYRPSEDSKMRSLDRPFDAVAREQFILNIYEKVDPIDDHTPNLGTITESDSVFAHVVDPAVIKVRWSVDGTTVLDGSAGAFDLSDNGFGLGSYEVTAFAYDPTEWVRTDRAPLQQTVHWTIDVPTGATAADDSLAGTERSDKILALAGDDTVSAHGGADFLAGQAGNDRLFGQADNDRLFGGTGNDRLLGGTGDDRLYGGDGWDRLFGGLGDDTYTADAVDRIVERSGGGTDTVRSTASHTLEPNIENLSLLGSLPIDGTGNVLDNRLLGNGAANRLDGAGGDDVLAGGLGADRLTGGAGADRFDFDGVDACGAGPARDVITDFDGAEGDKVDLSAIDAEAETAGDQAFRFIGARAFDSAAGEVRCSDGIVQGDIDGDQAPDFELQLLGLGSMRAADVLL